MFVVTLYKAPNNSNLASFQGPTLRAWKQGQTVIMVVQWFIAWCRSVLHGVAFHLYFCSADTSKPTIKQLTIELYKNLASEWNLIGILLGISDGELSTISQREHGDPQKCLVAMLSVWLHQTNPAASWREIANAVDFIGKQDIAQQIRQKYCKDTSSH